MCPLLPGVAPTHACVPEVAAGWKWWNDFERRAASEGLKVLRVNVDETAIRRSADGHKGVIMMSHRTSQTVLLEKKAAERGTVTHIAFICDDPAVQPRLPQVIIANEHTLSKAQLRSAVSWVPDNVYVCRAKSSWADSAVFAAALRWLAHATVHLKTTHRIIVLLDCCAVHLHSLVRATAKTNHMFLCYVPTGMTWLLQPCDTHLFRKYKNVLRTLFAAEQVQQRDHALDTLCLVKLICQAVRQVLQGTNWAQTFDHNGWGKAQAEVSTRVSKVLDMATIGTKTHGNCTLDDVHLLLPRGRTYDAAILQHCFQPAATAATPPLLPADDAASSRTACEAMGRFHHAMPDNAAANTPPPGMAADSDSDWLHRLRPRIRGAASSSSGPAPLPPPTDTLDSESAPPCLSWMPRVRRLPRAPPSQRPQQRAGEP